MKPSTPSSAPFFWPPEPDTQRNPSGWRFQIWAPEAAAVSVAGDFQGWQIGQTPLTRSAQGVWTGFVPEAKSGDCYKYVLHHGDGTASYCADPTALAVESAPDTAGQLWTDSGYPWQDAPWRAFWREFAHTACPLLLCPLALNTQVPEAYCDLIPKLKRLGYTGGVFSLGMGQQTSFFAPCAGWQPEELMAWVDAFHQAGLSVFLDWNATEFSPTYGAFLASEGYPNQFDWNRPALRQFLRDCAQFWMGTYHMDGLRLQIEQPLCFFPNRNVGAFLSELQQDIGKAFPHGRLFLRTPFPLESWHGHTESSAQPLVDLFLRKTTECSASLIDHALLTFPCGDSTAALHACYLTYLTLPGGKQTALGGLPEPVLQRLHRFYLSQPRLWPDSPFQWVHPPTEELPVLAFYRGSAATGRILCLCNPTECAHSLPLLGTFCLLYPRNTVGTVPVPIFSAVPERLCGAESILIPPQTCLLFDEIACPDDTGAG